MIISEAKGGDKVPLQLKTIEKIQLGETADVLHVQMENGMGLALVDGKNGVSLKRDHIWIEAAAKSGTPVAYDQRGEYLLPATVALNVTPADLQDTATDERAFFIFPRPAAVYLKLNAGDFGRLNAALKQAVVEKSGAIFALRDAIFIEDIVLISQKEAMKLLNLKPSN